MGLNQAWVDEASAWLRTPMPSVLDQIAQARDQLRQQWIAEEQERRGRSQVAQASSMMGPPQTTSTRALKRKQPEWNAHLSPYANAHPTHRQRIDVQGATVNTTSQAPPIADYSPLNGSPNVINTWTPDASISWNFTPHQVGRTSDTININPAAPNGNPHGNPQAVQPRGQPTQTSGSRVSLPASAAAESVPVALAPAAFTAATLATTTSTSMAPAAAALASSRPPDMRTQVRPPAETSSARLGDISSPPPSPLAIKQEAAQPSTDGVPTSTQPPRSHTSPVINTTEPIEPVTANARNSASVGEGEGSNTTRPMIETSSPTIVEMSTIPSNHAHEEVSAARTSEDLTTFTGRQPPCTAQGQESSACLPEDLANSSLESLPNGQFGEVSQRSLPVEGPRLDHNHTEAEPQQVLDETSINRAANSPAGEQSEEVQPNNDPSRIEERRSSDPAEVNKTYKSPARACMTPPYAQGRTDTLAISPSPEMTTTRNDQDVVIEAGRSPGTSSTTARASPASVNPKSPLIVPLSHRQSKEPTAVDDAVSLQDHSHDDHAEDGTLSSHQSPSVASKDLPGRNLPVLRQVDTADSRASSSSLSSPVSISSPSLSSPVSLSAFSPRQSLRVEKPSHDKSRSTVSSPKSPEDHHIESGSRGPSVESYGQQGRSTPDNHSSKTARVEASSEVPVRTNSPVDRRRPSATSAASPVNTETGDIPETHSPTQTPGNLWSDRRQQTQPSTPRFPRMPAAESIPSKPPVMADHSRRRLGKIWPDADLTKYEPLGEDLVYLASKRIPEAVVQAHINAEALYRMEKKTRKQDSNLSGNPHPTQRDCAQAKERYQKWQDQNPGVAPKDFPPPDPDRLRNLKRKFGVEVSQNGFLDYHSEPGQISKETNQDSSARQRKIAQPEWYKKINLQKIQARPRGGGSNTGVDAKLGRFKALVRRCAEAKEVERRPLFDDIRKELHELVFLEVNDVAVRRAQMLHEATGLPQIFAAEHSKGVNYPWDLQADAFELYNRWCTKTFSVDLLRGIVRSSKNNRATDRIEPGFAGKSGAAYYGQGNLVNGQWWPTQLCTVRDGAHGSTQGGIYAVKGKPAFSIIVSGGSQYNDRDEGDELWYSGTYLGANANPSDGKFSENTQSLILSVEERKPVRVIRSHNMHKRESRFRPLRGFRYDGLYEVVGYQVVNAAQGGCLFHLVRCPGQDPIRAEGISIRPTDKEIAEYDKIKKFL